MAPFSRVKAVASDIAEVVKRTLVVAVMALVVALVSLAVSLHA
jgi:hypothetical protein